MKCLICKKEHLFGEGEEARKKSFGIIRGYIWKLKTWNEAIFDWWTPEKVTRQIAKLHLLDIANGGEYYDKKEGIYADNSEDIISIWETKG
jgi:hypothetical protein